jgi:hypothetical protein
MALVGDAAGMVALGIVGLILLKVKSGLRMLKD